MKELEQLEAVSKEIRQKITEYKIAHRRWATWNYHSKQEDWYFLWAYESALKEQDLRAAYDHGEKVDLDQEAGAGYYANRHLVHHELEQLRLKQKDLLRYLWRHTDSRGYYTYSRQEIADHYASHLKTPTQRGQLLDKKLRTYDWFQTRNEMEGKKLWSKTKRHLRVV